jgi:hypothetical protein
MGNSMTKSINNDDNQITHKNLLKALERSVDFLDPSSKQVLLSYLSEKFNISFEDHDNKTNISTSVKEIEAALSKILKAGAPLVLKRFNSELDALKKT